MLLGDMTAVVVVLAQVDVNLKCLTIRSLANIDCTVNQYWKDCVLCDSRADSHLDNNIIDRSTEEEDGRKQRSGCQRPSILEFDELNGLPLNIGYGVISRSTIILIWSITDRQPTGPMHLFDKQMKLLQ